MIERAIRIAIRVITITIFISVFVAMSAFAFGGNFDFGLFPFFSTMVFILFFVIIISSITTPFLKRKRIDLRNPYMPDDPMAYELKQHIYCKYCGTYISGSKPNFCPACGKSLKD